MVRGARDPRRLLLLLLLLPPLAVVAEDLLEAREELLRFLLLVFDLSSCFESSFFCWCLSASRLRE